MLSTDEINGMLVNQLKEELKLRGASIAGKKADLCSRLIALMSEDTPAEKSDSSEQEGALVKPDTGEKKDVSKVSEEEKVVEATVNDSVPVQGDGDSAQEVATNNNDTTKEMEIPMEASANSGYTHVRIDNFQRPLNQLGLVKWIESQCQCLLAADSVWINAIKTHCYVDFTTEEEAQRCVDTVTGKRFPASSPYLLEADFTSVSAKEAPNSVESSLKPGAWKAAVQVSSASDVNAQAPQVEIEMELEESAVHSNKRKLDEIITDSADTLANSPPSSTNKARRSAGLDIFRRATAGILFTRTGLGGGPSAVYEAPPGVVSNIGASSMEIEENNATPSAHADSATAAASAASAGRGVSLEDLFRKTVTALPSLYWMPAPDEVVQQRLKSRLMSKGNHRG